MAKILSKEIISLIHHQSLNEQGWRDKSIQNFIVFIIYEYGSSLAVQEITTKMKDDLGVGLSNEEAQAAINILVQKNRLIDQQLKYKIPEEERKKIVEEISSYKNIEKVCKEVFLKIIENCCLGKINYTWEFFDQEVITPVISENGARAVDIIASREVSDESCRGLKQILDVFGKKYNCNIEELTLNFLNNDNESVREFLFLKIKAYFSLEANSLSEKTLESIKNSYSIPPVFNIFLDTNFLLSYFGFHDQEAHDAAISFVDLTKKINGRVNIKLYVAPITLNEARASLTRIRDKWSSVKVTENLAKISEEISLIPYKFIEITNRTKKSPDILILMDDQINCLQSILKSDGIDLFNQKIEFPSTSQIITGDIVEQLEYEKNRKIKFPGRSPKQYEQWDHDITMWHFVQEKRPAVIDSPPDAQYWILTEDYSFLSYDFRKRRKGHLYAPICISLFNLVQILQFWSPRSKELESALVTNLNHSIAFKGFDVDAEIAANRIVRQLSHYENFSELSEESIEMMLTNKTLKQKMLKESDESKQYTIIDGALIDEVNRLKELSEQNVASEKERIALAEKVSRLETISEQNAKEAQDFQRKYHEKEEEREEIELREKTVEATAQAERIGLLNQIDGLKKDKEDKEKRDLKRRKIGRIILVTASALSFLGAIYINNYLSSINQNSHISSGFIFLGTVLILNEYVIIWKWLFWLSEKYANRTIFWSLLPVISLVLLYELLCWMIGPDLAVKPFGFFAEIWQKITDNSSK